jgi:hypothetical protein
MDRARIIVRLANSADRNFIFSTWLKGQRFNSFYYSEIPQDLYFREYAKVIERILAGHEIEVRVACDESKPEWIAGFAVLDCADEAIHWIYVRGGEYRGNGIARLLLANRRIRTARSTSRIGRAIMAKHGIVFNPFGGSHES